MTYIYIWNNRLRKGMENILMMSKLLKLLMNLHSHIEDNLKFTDSSVDTRYISRNGYHISHIYIYPYIYGILPIKRN